MFVCLFVCNFFHPVIQRQLTFLFLSELVFDICPLPLAPHHKPPPLLPLLLSLGSDATGSRFSLPPTLIHATAAALIVRGPSLVSSSMYVDIALPIAVLRRDDEKLFCLIF